MATITNFTQYKNSQAREEKKFSEENINKAFEVLDSIDIAKVLRGITGQDPNYPVNEAKKEMEKFVKAQNLLNEYREYVKENNKVEN